MPASKFTVVANATYPVCLDSGRHLHPGEITEVEASERHLRLIADGHLRRQSEATEPGEAPKPALLKAALAPIKAALAGPEPDKENE